MKKNLFLAISVIIIFCLTFSGCGTNVPAVLSASPTDSVSAVSTETPLYTITETPSAMPSPSEVITDVNGSLPEFTLEKNSEWREITKKNIINFLTNEDYQKDNKLLPLSEDNEFGDIGIMGTGMGTIHTPAISQVYLLGGETRNGRWIIYLGAKDRSENKIVFPAQFDWTGNGIYTQVFTGSNYIDSMGQLTEPIVIDQSDVNAFEKILNEQLNKPIFVQSGYELHIDFETFYEMVGSYSGYDKEKSKKDYDNFKECDMLAKQILCEMNLVNKSVEEEDLVSSGMNLDNGIIPIINDVGEVEALFDNYSPRPFPWIMNLYILN